MPGHDLPGVISFRDMQDVEHMLAAAERGGSAVVIGGGLLGLEAAHGLSLRGMTVTVLHLMPTLMERQLDEAAGWLLKQALEGAWPDRADGADTAAILGDGKVEAIRLKDGREIAADLVVMAVGIRPRSRSPAPPGWRSGAASRSTTIWSRPTRASWRSANASSMTDRSMAWSRRSGTCAAASPMR